MRSAGSRHAGLVLVAHQLSLLCSLWHLPGPRIEPVSPASAGGPILDHWNTREVPLLTLRKGLVQYPAGHTFSIKVVGSHRGAYKWSSTAGNQDFKINKRGFCPTEARYTNRPASTACSNTHGFFKKRERETRIT